MGTGVAAVLGLPRTDLGFRFQRLFGFWLLFYALWVREHSLSSEEKGREELEENFTRHAPQSMQQDIFFYCCVPSLLCTCAWRDACVCVCVYVWCAAVYYYFTCAIFCHVPFRLVWFRFGFCFCAFIFSTAFTAPFINNSHWFLLFLATPPALLCSFSLFFAVRKCSLLIFLYFVVCSLAASPAIHM